MKNLLILLGFVFSFEALSSEVVKIISKTSDVITSGDVVFAQISGDGIKNYQQIINQIPFEIIIPMNVDDQSNLKIVIGAKFNPLEIINLSIDDTNYSIEFVGFNWSSIQNNTNKDFNYLVEAEKRLEQSILTNPTLYMGLSLVAALIYIFSLLLRGINKKKAIRRKYISWIRRIESAETIDSMSLIWRDRLELKEVFESKIEDITDFFTVLNKYQFSKNKPNHAMDELSKAKAILIEKLRGDSHGV
jgi:hypothetical protein